MKKVLIIDFTIDKIGGVERIVSLLANNLCEKFQTDVCSLYRNANQPFFEYTDKVNRIYLIDNTRCLSSKTNSKLMFFALRAVERLFELIFLGNRIAKISEIVFDYDTIIFGRKSSAVRFLPYLKNYNGRIIVREANNLPYTSAYEKKRIKALFPGKVRTMVVSSDECISSYNKFFTGNNDIKVVKIYNPLGITPVKKYNSEAKKIIGVGRYTRDKGFENLIYAFSLIQDEFPDWSLNLIGSGEYYKRYKRLCRELNVSDRVNFRKSNNVSEEYANASICVSTSRDEGYANSLVEAMACGVPCISVNWYEGVEEIVENEKNGLIVRLEDRHRYCYGDGIDKVEAEKIADALRKLMANRFLREKYSEEAMKITESRDNDRIFMKWENII